MVLSPQQGIQQFLVTAVAGSGVAQGNADALQASLTAAVASLDRGHANAALNQLNAFKHKVAALSGNNLSASAAQELTALADRVMASILN